MPRLLHFAILTGQFIKVLLNILDCLMSICYLFVYLYWLASMRRNRQLGTLTEHFVVIFVFLFYMIITHMRGCGFQTCASAGPCYAKTISPTELWDSFNNNKAIYCTTV